MCGHAVGRNTEPVTYRSLLRYMLRNFRRRDIERLTCGRPAKATGTHNKIREHYAKLRTGTHTPTRFHYRHLHRRMAIRVYSRTASQLAALQFGVVSSQRLSFSWQKIAGKAIAPSGLKVATFFGLPGVPVSPRCQSSREGPEEHLQSTRADIIGVAPARPTLRADTVYIALLTTCR